MMLIPIHVLGGTVAILSGLVALYASKGGLLHRKSGTLFVAPCSSCRSAAPSSRSGVKGPQ